MRAVTIKNKFVSKIGVKIAQTKFSLCLGVRHFGKTALRKCHVRNEDLGRIFVCGEGEG